MLDLKRSRAGALFAILVGILALQTGCSHVAAYDRHKLAHPTMAAGGLAGPGEEHMYSVQEGASGGGAASESGCGCN